MPPIQEQGYEDDYPYQEHRNNWTNGDGGDRWNSSHDRWDRGYSDDRYDGRRGEQDYYGGQQQQQQQDAYYNGGRRDRQQQYAMYGQVGKRIILFHARISPVNGLLKMLLHGNEVPNYTEL